VNKARRPLEVLVDRAGERRHGRRFGAEMCGD